ncbi:hypothetical protein [Larsenimonas suaedae]|uniref:Lipoprotein n=1 Tax=Larsenimonas suaedae TaxID=1851019 RepID=A0ABU1GVX6_9GAMM|nr:hypothetical protein [Larsenimonas suaedae]MCM2972035.1 hypothetical protein [Larsenimonas suaedae]MDR5895587.1 hypothetical protein [Larsenimonas suaedae]
MKRILPLLILGSTLALAGCDRAPNKDDVSEAMHNTLDQQISQLKAIAQQMGGDNKLDNIEYSVNIDEVKECAHPAPKDGGENTDDDTAKKQDTDDLWSCQVKGKVVVDGKAQKIDDKVILFKNDDGEWQAR